MMLDLKESKFPAADNQRMTQRTKDYVQASNKKKRSKINNIDDDKLYIIDDTHLTKDKFNNISNTKVGNKHLLNVSQSYGANRISVTDKYAKYKEICKTTKMNLKTQNFNHRRSRLFTTSQNQFNNNSKSTCSMPDRCKDHYGGYGIRKKSGCKLNKGFFNKHEYQSLHNNIAQRNDIVKTEPVTKDNGYIPLSSRKNCTTNFNKVIDRIKCRDIITPFKATSGTRNNRSFVNSKANNSFKFTADRCKKLLQAPINGTSFNNKIEKNIIEKKQSKDIGFQTPPKPVTVSKFVQIEIKRHPMNIKDRSVLFQKEINGIQDETPKVAMTPEKDIIEHSGIEKTRHTESNKADYDLDTLSKLSHNESQDVVLKSSLPIVTNLARNSTLLESVFLMLELTPRNDLQLLHVPSLYDIQKETNACLKLPTRHFFSYSYIKPLGVYLHDAIRNMQLFNIDYKLCTILDMNKDTNPNKGVMYDFNENTKSCYKKTNMLQITEIESDDQLTKSMKQHKKVHKSKINIKLRKYSFNKLYKKSKPSCKGEKTTSLSKIKTSEDFFEALGSRNTCCVFGELCGKKILSSLEEMKNWISEINQKQAMLLLLLSNKKDTPKLVQFRSVILQGIAENRIIRASGLDMEVEIVETAVYLDNALKASKYEELKRLQENFKNALEKRKKLFKQL